MEKSGAADNYPEEFETAKNALDKAQAAKEKGGTVKEHASQEKK